MTLCGQIITQMHSRRLATVIKKLKTQQEIMKKYDQVIKEQLEGAVAEEVQKDQVLEPGNVHYLLHRRVGVVRLDRDTAKVRVVYDTSCKVFAPSLNDCLHVGPSLNPLLLDILLRFRVHEIAVTADIEKAFLNIKIDPEHRDFLRFLWIDDVNKESPAIKLIRFTRVVFGVNASPFILNATIRHHVNICMLNDNAFALEFLKSLYVDDFASGAKDVNKAFSLSKEIKLCPKSGRFNMRKRNSNSVSLLQSLKQDAAFSGDFATNSKVFKQGTEREQRILGMLWNPNQDELVYDLTKILQGVEIQPATRRLILSTATRFFDPLGLISPVILPFKIMFQKLCKAQRDWDELVDTQLNQEWLSFLSDLRPAGRVSFKRCHAEGLGRNEVKSLQLHCFADASEKAYRAVVYMRVEYESRVECEIVASKTRVTPLNKQTIRYRV